MGNSLAWRIGGLGRSSVARLLSETGGGCFWPNKRSRMAASLKFCCLRIWWPERVAVRAEFLEEVERDQKPGGRFLARVMRVELGFELGGMLLGVRVGRGGDCVSVIGGRGGWGWGGSSGTMYGWVTVG